MKVFVGFGFGAIQGGLFAYEAFKSGSFDRIVISEVVPAVVDRVRKAGGRYKVLVATPDGLEEQVISGVEIYDPAQDRKALVGAISEASELCTALPSVDFFGPVAELLAEGLKTPCVIYTAENNNHAAEILEAAVRKLRPQLPPCQFLNTVIGKMSGVGDGAFLVEQFNRILITKVTLPGFERGIGVFEEKEDLLPFEEAKLYGHNAAHALLGLIANSQGLRYMSDSGVESREYARAAFLEESGGAMMARHAGIDPLFTPAGWQAYVEDLMARMTNPWLKDEVKRVIRDLNRKLSWNDRVVGTMRLALDAGVEPRRYARALALGCRELGGIDPETLWNVADEPAGRKRQLKELMHNAT